ncbi:MAG: D-glycero-beta-D-manno-heptose 1-phosphate adenylyltransferase [Gemmataceae bacterium]|nr:D-glycero-beta-D-manno-heptose 1-phosphate adenylyltransferase [Gemmataceae bacterium]MDW8266197.1 D-glycero-beta-D-manno-heptose 1-phosphate adenylyltransferase [Gemmataceae bacterium]
MPSTVRPLPTGRSADLIELVQNLGQPRVLVVGDVMLDRYIWGDAERISQEAPVVLLRADKREEKLGGASSVATMLRALGARVGLAGVVGNDADAARVRQILTDLSIDHDGVIVDTQRPTTVKERYIGRAQHRHPQQMIRVDYETRLPVSGSVEEELGRAIAHQVRKADIVLISDYDKGVCTPGILASLIATARGLGLRVLADPIRGHDYRKYHGCSALTPNRLEAGLATGRCVQTTDDALQAAAQLQAQLDLEAGIVTLDKDGMALAHRDGRRLVFPTRPRQVYDITGAGDMVLSVLGMALAAGADYDAAIRLANVAGGLEVEKIGVATVTRDEILRDLLGVGPAGSHKIVDRAVLRHELDCRRRLGQRVAFTNGCFDVLHAGHVQYLEEARAQADVLVVGLNSDESVRALKGEGRPVNDVHARARVLAGLQAVDYVTIFSEPTPLGLIEVVRPDVLVKGADYRKDEVVGAAFVESYGGRVHLAEFRPGYSTTWLLQRLKAA